MYAKRMLHSSSGRKGYSDNNSKQKVKGSPSQCPIPKDVLLEMVKEEAELRVGKEFQEKVAKEEREAITDGTNSIVALQVGTMQI